MLTTNFQPFLAEAVHSPAWWSLLPFALLLVSIAAMPFIHKRFWDKFYPHIAAGLGGIVVLYYALVIQDWHVLGHSAHEYLSFMALVGSLYIAAGGIHIRVEGRARPLFNAAFLAIGAVLSNLIGTTGASMLLIRPWIRLNQTRIRPYQIIFFIFIVSNCGGCLTPIGDPPLFLGYLKGIPFFWCLEKLWEPWLVMNLGLLVLFVWFDSREFNKLIAENPAYANERPRWEISGLHNLVFIALILIGIFLPSPSRELIMVASGIGSFFLTPKKIHLDNQFNFHPIEEVGWLFLGIFATMIPALDFLKVHTAEVGLSTPSHYYYACSLFSGLLDNAPTYLTFLTTALAGQQLSIGSHSDVHQALQSFPDIVVAISLSAVFGGALTYIGNGPNFMVKAIAEQANIRMPSFFGYLLTFSLPIMLPLLVLIGWLFVHQLAPG